jgi:acetylornithine/succinyldiaminopimelate/putrescine aminotransferase
MRNQLETFKTLFEQVRGLGIVMQLPNESNFKFSNNIQIYFADNYDTTSISFGDRYSDQLEIMKYSARDNSYKVSFPLNVTDEQLEELIEVVQSEYKQIKIDYLESELSTLKGNKVVA